MQTSCFSKTPLHGLNLLQKLHNRHPYNQAITNGLINAYIKLGYPEYHDKALSLIEAIPQDKINIQNLKFQAWKAHIQGNVDIEKQLWSKILDKQYFAQVEAPIGTLLQRSQHEISLTDQDISLICVERNEILRLPSFLEHYRNLGVTQFFFVDNNSDDGSFEYLLDQADCHVFWTNDSYLEAGFGVVWQHQLIDVYLSKHWYIIADADELLIYPECENVSLSVLFSYLDSYNYQVVPGFMLDMFPKLDSDGSDVDKKHNLIEASPYFYNEYRHYHQINCPYYQIGGGIRSIVFGENTVAYTKTPIAHGYAHLRYLSSTHITTPAIISDITTVFLHFKFVGDAHAYFESELKRKEHADGALRYREYKKFFEAQDGFDISKLPKAMKYKDSQQLVELGLIKTSDEWENFKK